VASPPAPAAVPGDCHVSTTTPGTGRYRHLGYPPSNSIRFLC